MNPSDIPKHRGPMRSTNIMSRKVPDPFRPLEDPDSAATRAWVEAENRVTFRVPGIDPASVPRSRRRLTAAVGLREVQPAVARKVGVTSSHTTPGLQNQSVLYTTRIGAMAPVEILLDPEHALAPTGPSPWPGTAEQGRSAPRLRHRRGRFRLERVEGPRRRDRTGSRPITSSGSSSRRPTGPPDGQGFFYGRFPEPKPGEDLKGANYYQKVYYHRLGTPQADDLLVWEDPEHKEWRAVPPRHRRRQVPDPDRREGDRRRSTASSTGLSTSPTSKPVHLVGEFDAEYDFIDNDGPVFWFKTNKDAAARQGRRDRRPRPEPEQWVEMIPQAAETLEHVHRGRRPFPGRLPEGRPLRRPGPST